MRARPSPSEPPDRDPTILGVVTASTDEDPFGTGDPLEVARLVRRALAAADRKARDVAGLVIVTDRAPAGEALARFTRRALGPHGATIPTSVELVGGATDHRTRCGLVERASVPVGRIVVLVVLGPRPHVSAVCLRGHASHASM